MICVYYGHHSGWHGWNGWPNFPYPPCHPGRLEPAHTYQFQQSNPFIGLSILQPRGCTPHFLRDPGGILYQFCGVSYLSTRFRPPHLQTRLTRSLPRTITVKSPISPNHPHPVHRCTIFPTGITPGCLDQPIISP